VVLGESRLERSAARDVLALWSNSLSRWSALALSSTSLSLALSSYSFSLSSSCASSSRRCLRRRDASSSSSLLDVDADSLARLRVGLYKFSLDGGLSLLLRGEGAESRYEEGAVVSVLDRAFKVELEMTRCLSAGGDVVLRRSMGGEIARCGWRS
jgi:hypothetical protein